MSTWRATITWADNRDNSHKETHECIGEAHQVVLDAARAGKIPHDRPFKIEVEEVKS